MLNKDTLESQLAETLHNVIPVAAKQALISIFEDKSEYGEDMAEQFSTVLDETLSDALAKGLASAIDYYIKTASIYGTLLCTGPSISPIYTCTISPSLNLGNPAAGSVPNTLGIQ